MSKYYKAKAPCLINVYIRCDVLFLVRPVALRNARRIGSVPCKVRMFVDRIAQILFVRRNSVPRTTLNLFSVCPTVSEMNMIRAGRKKNCLSFYKSRANILLNWTEYLECLAVLTPANCTAARKLFDEKIEKSNHSTNRWTEQQWNHNNFLCKPWHAMLHSFDYGCPLTSHEVASQNIEKSMVTDTKWDIYYSHRVGRNGSTFSYTFHSLHSSSSIYLDKLSPDNEEAVAKCNNNFKKKRKQRLTFSTLQKNTIISAAATNQNQWWQ